MQRTLQTTHETTRERSAAPAARCEATAGSLALRLDRPCCSGAGGMCKRFGGRMPLERCSRPDRVRVSQPPLIRLRAALPCGHVPRCRTQLSPSVGRQRLLASPACSRRCRPGPDMSWGGRPTTSPATRCDARHLRATNWSRSCGGPTGSASGTSSTPTVPSRRPTGASTWWRRTPTGAAPRCRSSPTRRTTSPAARPRRSPRSSTARGSARPGGCSPPPRRCWWPHTCARPILTCGRRWTTRRPSAR